MAISQDKRLLSISTAAGPQVLLLDQLAVTEQISRPFQIDVTMMAEIEAGSPDKVKPRDLIGTLATITVGLAEGTPRYFHGMISRFSAGGRDRQFAHYKATIVPALTLLQLASNCRIFQNMSAKEVLEEVLGHYTSLATEYHLNRTYTKRDYCTQFRETDFAFVSRLMEEEGIFYYFTHSQNRHAMVIGDNAQAYAACPVNSEVVFGPSRLTAEEALLDSWTARHQIFPGRWTMRDYSFQQPGNRLEGTAPAVQPVDAARALERYEWPGGNVTLFNQPDKRLGEMQGEADAFATLRMEQEEVDSEVFEGAGNAAGLTTGHTFEVKSRGVQSVSGKYVLTSVHHSAMQNPPYLADRPAGAYTNRFSCLKDTVVYRPPLGTPKPLIHGLQTAKVVDESDPGDTEEIWPDKYGRVRCRFPWDREGKSACWVRVTQQRAGKSWGFIWIPRVGDEVVISYVDGDPDHPLIVGSLYNSDNPVPYALPDNKTQHGIKTMSSPRGGSENYNEFFIEDKKGEELIRLHAEKDLHTEVENDEIRKVDRDRTTTIKRHEAKTVEEGDETHTVKAGKRTTTIHADEVTTVETGKCSLEVQQGDHLITVKQGKQTTKVEMGDQINEVGMGKQTNTVKMGDIVTEASMGKISTKASMGDITTEASLGNISIKASLGKITLEALQGIELKVGPSTVKIDMSGVQISGLMTKVEGTVQTQVKGLITQVTADAMLKAGGAITMIG